MAVRKIGTDGHAGAPPKRTRPALAGQDAKLSRSPALELHAQLRADLGAQGRWPPIATLALVLGTCGGFWTALAWGVTRLVR